jgi:hypothetical protein
MKRKATMRNRRLTIFPLAMILMSGCDESSTAPEMLELIGTWQVASWTITQVAAPMTVVNPFVTAPVGGAAPIIDAALYLYDDGTLLSIFNFPDTLTSNSALPGGGQIFLDASEYPINSWCVFAAGEVYDSFCLKRDGEVPGATEFVIDAGDNSQQILTFVRNGDDMTLSGSDGVVYDFGGGAEPATVMMTLDRVIIDYDRPNITDNNR